MFMMSAMPSGGRGMCAKCGMESEPANHDGMGGEGNKNGCRLRPCGGCQCGGATSGALGADARVVGKDVLAREEAGAAEAAAVPWWWLSRRTRVAAAAVASPLVARWIRFLPRFSTTALGVEASAALLLVVCTDSPIAFFSLKLARRVSARAARPHGQRTRASETPLSQC